MAVTRLIAMHVNKGKSIRQCLKDRTDYAKNGEKTRNGQYVSAYACDPETVDQEFLLSKKEYLRISGRQIPGDIIAYQIRQSFKPGEISAEEANRIGYETAMRFTHGEHAFIVATHTDRTHIHNHIIFNSTSLSCDRKFKDSWFIALALQRLSDQICLEYCLSVIKPRKPGERDNTSPYHRVSFRHMLKENMDAILVSKPESFDAFLEALKDKGYKIKPGRSLAVRGNGQSRFLRFRSLGKGYTEENIRKRITGELAFDPEEERRSWQKSRRSRSMDPEADPAGQRAGNASGRIGDAAAADAASKNRSHGTPRHGSYGSDGKDFDLLIDINRKMQEGKGRGYERWAKIFNVKQMSKILLYLQEHDIRDYEKLQEKAKSSAAKFHELSDAIKEKEARLRDIADLKMQIINYVKTRDVYAEYRKSGYSKRFLESHRDEILLHQAAKKAFDKRGLGKLPHVKDLSSEYGSILAEKRKLYEEYRAAKKEMMNYQIAKQDIDRFLKIDEEQGRQEEKIR